MNRATLPALGLLTGWLTMVGGCGEGPQSDPTPAATPPKPPQAASQLQEAFVSAPAEVRQSAQVASEALRTANYEQAIKTLQVIRARPNLTPDQGIAVYNSQRALEASLISAMAAGDPNAKRAYEMLKRSRRN